MKRYSAVLVLLAMAVLAVFSPAYAARHYSARVVSGVMIDGGANFVASADFLYHTKVDRYGYGRGFGYGLGAGNFKHNMEFSDGEKTVSGAGISIQAGYSSSLEKKVGGHFIAGLNYGLAKLDSDSGMTMVCTHLKVAAGIDYRVSEKLALTAEVSAIDISLAAGAKHGVAIGTEITPAFALGVRF